jgi:excisionase family DNA binding protein
MSNQIIIQLSEEANEELFSSLRRIENLLIKISNGPQDENNELLTIEEAASILHLSKLTLYGLVHKKEMPSYKKGKRLYFSKDELVAWVKTGRKKTRTELTMEAEASFRNANKKK